jgi:hypothetical protein
MRFPLLPALAAAALLGAGCVSTVRVRSEPEGAMIRYRGEGRAAFRWKTAPTSAPTSFDVYYGRISVYGIWPDGSQSAHRTVTLSNWRDPDEIVVRPDPSVPRLQRPASAP